MSNEQTGLALLRQPFPEHQISYLPKGGVKLAYVGHAALTDRLLDADPAWTWEPLSMNPNGLPVMDELGGMWIRLTVCGVTRLGYGHAGSKTGGDAVKEVIGDALRNAAMRFGAALDLWHKGDLHPEEKPDVSAMLSNISASMTLVLLRTNYEAALLMLDATYHPAIKKANSARAGKQHKVREPDAKAVCLQHIHLDCPRFGITGKHRPVRDVDGPYAARG